MSRPQSTTREHIRRRMGLELGRIEKQGPRRVALTYPSPYTVGMSSLGFQQVYRLLSALPGVACERVFLADGAERPGPVELEPPVSYESLTPLSAFPVMALSVAYELELMGLLRLLKAAGIPRLAKERSHRHPFILAGGPLTFSNPLPLSPFVDAIVMGEGEGVVQWAVQTLFDAASRDAALEELALHPNIFVPALHGSRMPSLARAGDEHLPATSVIRTPDTELSNMFLIEAERGCSRTCTYCVMRRSSQGGMRRVEKDVILEKVPADAQRVGLVGAAVSDHPQIVEIVDALSALGKEVGLSSLRPDRLKEPLVFALKRAGYRTLTTALDGGSERLRETIERRGRVPHYESAAEHARAAGMQRMKLYLMVGLPTETDADMDECAVFVSELSKRLPISLGIAPFCAKRRTPLDAQPFAGIDVVQHRLERLRKGLKGRAEMRATSAKWAWVEYVMAQGDQTEGLALMQAVDAGGNFADYRRAFEALGYSTRGEQLPRLPSPGTEHVAPARRLRKSPADAGHKPLAVIG